MYNYSYSYNYGPRIGSLELFMLILPILAVAVLTFIAWCRILAKAQRNWWGMFIPFYGSYLQYEVADVSGIFWFNLIFSILSALLTLITPTIGGLLSVLSSILSIVFYIIHCVKLAQAFGHRGGFAVGLIFLNPIFIMILGFGSSTYSAAPGYQGVSAGSITWTCPSCSTVNPGNLGRCSNCNTQKQKYANVYSAQRGTWICPKCSSSNQMSSSYCPNCGTPKSNPAGSVPTTSGTWTCHTCYADNPSNLRRCAKCDTPR